MIEELQALPTDARLKQIDDALTMLINLMPLAQGAAARQPGKRVDISYALLAELPEEMDRIFAAIQVSEALGHRVELEIVREGNTTMIGAGLQFYTHRAETATP